jgi:hypothetical protein
MGLVETGYIGIDILDPVGLRMLLIDG